MSSKTKSFSKELQDLQYHPLGKRVRRPVSYNEEKIDWEEPPTKRRKKREVSISPPPRKGRKAKAPQKSKQLEFSSSEDEVLLDLDDDDDEDESSDELLVDLSSDSGSEGDPSDGGDNNNAKSDSDDDDDESDSSSEEELMDTVDTGPSIDKLLNHRVNDEGTEEYLIKWKDKSYWHVTWMPREELEEIAGGKARIRHYQPTEFDTFDPKLAEVDRVIDVDNDDNYLCKWNTLGYDESTWESADDIKKHGSDEKIEEYYERETMPPKKQCLPFKRPKPKEFDAEGVDIPQFKNDLSLHDYQEDGLKWLICSWYAQRSSILADEMVNIFFILHYNKM